MDAIKYDGDKTRFDLIPPSIKEVADVLTYGAQKYEDNNWRKGLKWSRTLAAAERHLQSFKAGEDFDPETNLSHLAHAACNLLFLMQFRHESPHLDDRYVHKPLKIGLDVDGVIADFDTSWRQHWNTDVPHGYCTWDFEEKLKSLEGNREFYLSIKPLIDSKEIKFYPDCYITARKDEAMLKEWLDLHKFPKRPIFVNKFGKEKATVCRERNIDIFVDDHYINYTQLHANGIFCYLMTANSNKHYNVGHRRINSLTELNNL